MVPAAPPRTRHLVWQRRQWCDWRRWGLSVSTNGDVPQVEQAIGGDRDQTQCCPARVCVTNHIQHELHSGGQSRDVSTYRTLCHPLLGASSPCELQPCYDPSPSRPSRVAASRTARWSHRCTQARPSGATLAPRSAPAALPALGVQHCGPVGFIACMNVCVRHTREG